LCVVDAVLNSSVATNLVGVLLTLQISAMGLIAMRVWLEQHIAKREATGYSKITITRQRSDNSMKTFGFDVEGPVKPSIVYRRSEDLRSVEDTVINAKEERKNNC
jgi:hypothetical protein